MQNRKRSVRKSALTLLLSLLLVGCGQRIYPEMPDDAIAFKMGEYTDESDDDALYGTIEYEGRTYMPYGTLGGSIGEKDIPEYIDSLE